MALADPPSPPPEPASPPAPPELPPSTPAPPVETPTTMAAGKELDTGTGAKPSAPGPADPPGIAATVLPEREKDAARADDPAPAKGR